MDTITVQAASAEEARQTAAQRYNVAVEQIECRPLPEAPAEETPRAEEPGAGSAEAERVGAEGPVVIGEGPLAFEARVRPQFWEREARTWVQGMMKWFGVLTEVRVQTVGTQIFVRLSCPEPSILIGKQGHTLEALQHVVTRALTTRWAAFPEVVVDVESYKEKKLQRLEHMARKAAERALRVGRPQDLEPMTASERKYIHNALKDMRSVRTISHGREPNRHVVVEPVDPTVKRPAEGRPDGGPPRRPHDPGRGRRYDDARPRPPFRPPVTPPERQPTPATGEETGDENLDWRPTFFKPPESVPVDPNQPYPDVEDDLHS